MNLQITQRTATDVYEDGVVKSQKLASVTYNVMDGEKQVGNASLTATGLNINMYSGLGEDLAKWESNINAALEALNQEV